MVSADQRRNQRVAIAPEAPQVNVHVHSRTGAVHTQTVRAHDLSRMGMSFVSGDPLEIGTRCTLLVRHRQRAMRLIGKVMNCRRTDGGHIIGVKFTSITPVPADAAGPTLTDDPAVDRLVVDIPTAQTAVE